MHTLYKKSPKIVYQITEAVFCGRLSCAVLSPEILFPLNVPKSSNIECSAKHTFASFECCCIKRSVCTSLSLSTCIYLSLYTFPYAYVNLFISVYIFLCTVIYPCVSIYQGSACLPSIPTIRVRVLLKCAILL